LQFYRLFKLLMVFNLSLSICIKQFFQRICFHCIRSKWLYSVVSMTLLVIFLTRKGFTGAELRKSHAARRTVQFLSFFKLLRNPIHNTSIVEIVTTLRQSHPSEPINFFNLYWHSRLSFSSFKFHLNFHFLFLHLSLDLILMRSWWWFIFLWYWHLVCYYFSMHLTKSWRIIASCEIMNWFILTFFEWIKAYGALFVILDIGQILNVWNAYWA